MMARYIAIALALVALMAGRQPAQSSPIFQERLPGFAGYCPLVVHPGDTVVFRVSVANASPETARGTVVEVRVPSGLVLDERAAYVAAGPGAGRFAPTIAVSAPAGIAWATTDAADEWRSYTVVVVARVAATAAGEQLAIALSSDSAGKLIRRVDGVVYVRPNVTRATSDPVVIDMGVPVTCQTEPTPTSTATPTPTPSPTSTPVPPPYFTKRLALTEAEGVLFSVAVVCVFDPGVAAKRPPAGRYEIVFEVPPNARLALALGANPDVSGDGIRARFEVRPDALPVRVAVASRPAPGEAAFLGISAPKLRVSAEGVGDLREGPAGGNDSCDVEPAIAQALVSAERAAQTAQLQAATAAAEATPQPSPTPVVTPSATPATPATPARPAGTAASSTLPAVGPIAPLGAPATAAVEASRAEIQPDPRSAMLPLVCGVGIALAALAFAFVARRREQEA